MVAVVVYAPPPAACYGGATDFLDILDKIGCKYGLPGSRDTMDPDASGLSRDPVFPFLGVEDPFTRVRLVEAANLVVERGRVNFDKPLVYLASFGTGYNVLDILNGLPVISSATG